MYLHEHLSLTFFTDLKLRRIFVQYIVNFQFFVMVVLNLTFFELSVYILWSFFWNNYSILSNRKNSSCRKQCKGSDKTGHPLMIRRLFPRKHGYKAFQGPSILPTPLPWGTTNVTFPLPGMWPFLCLLKSEQTPFATFADIADRVSVFIFYPFTKI